MGVLFYGFSQLIAYHYIVPLGVLYALISIAVSILFVGSESELPYAIAFAEIG